MYPRKAAPCVAMTRRHIVLLYVIAFAIYRHFLCLSQDLEHADRVTRGCGYDTHTGMNIFFSRGGNLPQSPSLLGLGISTLVQPLSSKDNRGYGAPTPLGFEGPRGFLLAILILSGDIHSNPGPVKFPCGGCGRAVATNHRAMQCDHCDQWVHIKCCGMGAKMYTHYQNSSCSWICNNCGLPSFSSSLFDFTSWIHSREGSFYSPLQDMDMDEQSYITNSLNSSDLITGTSTHSNPWSSVNSSRNRSQSTVSDTDSIPPFNPISTSSPCTTQSVDKGVILSHNLRWKAHINGIIANANSTLGFVRRNLRGASKQDLLSAVKTIVTFLEVELDESTMKGVTEACTFENMKAALTSSEIPEIRMLVRKGIVGDWKNMFSPEQNKAFDAWYEKKLGGTGINFEFE